VGTDFRRHPGKRLGQISATVCFASPRSAAQCPWSVIPTLAIQEGTTTVEGQDLPTAVLDDEEAVQQPEGHRGYREQVEGDDHLAMIPEKGQPPFARVTAALNTPKTAGDGPFRDNETEFQSSP